MPTSNHRPNNRETRHRHSATLALATGTLMAIYLLLRPYGDAGGGETRAAADAFASPMWIWSHLAGAAAVVALAALWALISTGLIRWAALAGAALVLPYYGAETFALHAIGIRAQTRPDVLSLVPAVRDNPVAMTLFGIGLITLAAAGTAAALRWRRAQTPRRTRIAGAYLPLAVVAALFLPQFFLLPAGRIAYGLLFAVAAAYAAYAPVTAADEPATPDRPAGRRADRVIPSAS